MVCSAEFKIEGTFVAESQKVKGIFYSSVMLLLM